MQEILHIRKAGKAIMHAPPMTARNGFVFLPHLKTANFRSASHRNITQFIFHTSHPIHTNVTWIWYTVRRWRTMFLSRSSEKHLKGGILKFLSSENKYAIKK